jgi:very-short-patch-repair endonuclease
MAVEIVDIQVSVKMSPNAALLVEVQGNQHEYTARLVKHIEERKAWLNALLNDGYMVISSHGFDASDGQELIIVLYKPDDSPA